MNNMWTKEMVVYREEIPTSCIFLSGGKVVDPENIDSACLFSSAPNPQSYNFIHEHSEIVKGKR